MKTRSSIRAVLATDSPTIREMLRTHLECLGCSVIAEAINAAQALRLCRMAAPEIVIVDTAVPSLDGIDSTQLLRTIRAESPASTLVIVVSDPSDPAASKVSQEVSHNLRIDPGEHNCFEQMWRGLSAIYPELQRPAG
jgi:DNA-binding NarL/FixJ family response regulator